jgi:small subunit ribosomal protein S2
MEKMFQAGVHFGYSRSHRHPKMKSFIFLNRNDTDIFDLEKTEKKLSCAKEFLKTLGKEKKTILFLGTKKEAREAVEKSAKDLDMPYVRERWLGGTLTNFKEIKKRIEYLNDLLEKRDSGELEKYTKKERLQIVKKIRKLEKYLKGLQQCKNLPAALVVIDSNMEKIAIKEAKVMHIPVVAIMNSDCNPEEVDYPIPANDSSIASINYLLEELVKAYSEGRMQINE